MLTTLEQILRHWNIRITAAEVLDEWNKEGRYYHNQTHLFDLIDQIQLLNIDEETRHILYLVAVFHDIVYDPKRQDNEEQSAEYFLGRLPAGFDARVSKLVYNSIIETKTHQPTSSLSQLFCRLDMSIAEADFDTLLKWENGIWLEYSSYGKEAYKAGRIKFLKSLLDAYPDNRKNLEQLVAFVETY